MEKTNFYGTRLFISAWAILKVSQVPKRHLFVQCYGKYVEKEKLSVRHLRMQ